MSPGLRNVLICLIVLNLLAAIGSYVITSLHTGAARLVVMSRYRELQHAHVIRVDPQAFKQYRDDLFAKDDPEDWPVIPEYLSEGYGDAITVGLWIAAAFAANAVALTCVVIAGRNRRNANPTSSPVNQAGITGACPLNSSEA